MSGGEDELAAPATSAVRAPLVAIVEDDPAIAEGLALNLKLLGYRSEVIPDGESARARIREGRPDLVLLDISLPKQSGIWVLERLREAQDQVPVIVLSARQDEFDKVAALRLGADDYVTKPFALAELLARVDAVLRRSRLSGRGPATAGPGPEAVVEAAAPATPERAGEGGSAAGSVLSFGDLVIDLSSRTVARGGEPVKLTHLEFELLSFFCRHVRRVFSREELVREVWGLRQAGQARTVDNFVAQLRAKLEQDPEAPRHLLTVRGSGYRFAPE
ncbi:MAG TPA: response regulator transcription factor [Polyangia bacterium]|nr:response regulator transcription factor [Polyangia bacterium]